MSSSLLPKNKNIQIYRTKILSVVLYRCGTWWFTLKDERRLRVLENRVLRRMFGLFRDKVTGKWLTLHNEELYGFYSYYSGDKIEKNWMGGACSTYGGDERGTQGFSGET